MSAPKPPGMVPGGSDRNRTAAVVDVGLVGGEGTVRVAPEGWAVSSLSRTCLSREVIDLPDMALALEIAQARVALSRCSDDYLRGWAAALGDLQDAVWEKWHPPLAPQMRVTFGLLVVRAVNAGLLWTPDLPRSTKSKRQRRGNPTHGLASTYRSYACRCGPCTAANLEKQKRDTEVRAARLAADPSLAPHGRKSTYQNWRCRCEPCTRANSAGSYEYKVRTGRINGGVAS